MWLSHLLNIYLLRHEAKAFDLQSATVPLILLDRTFLMRGKATVEDYLGQPLTLLGLKMQPFNFHILCMPQLMDMAGTIPGPPGLAAKQRRKHKINCRKK